MTRLVPCSGCQRHVRLDEAACPFCGGAVDAAKARPEGITGAGLSRAAALALGTALAAACSTPGGQPNDPGAAMYGGAPPPANSSSLKVTPPDANPDKGSTASMYGMATARPVPSNSAAPKPLVPAQPTDETGPVAAYGAPPPPMPTAPPPPPAPPKKK